MSIETRWHQLNRHVTDKVRQSIPQDVLTVLFATLQLRESERVYESRKSFLNRFDVFERSVRDVTEQVDNNAQIQTATWNQTLQRLQQLLKQLESLQPLVGSISEELAELEQSGLAKADLQSVKNNFESNRQRLNA